MIGDSSTSTATPIEHPPGFRVRRAQNWVFLGLMYGFFYMSRYNFAAINDAIGEKFGWTNTQYGSIVTFGLSVYGFSVFLNGPLADKIGGKRAILLGSCGAAIFNLLFGLCHIFLLKPAVMAKGTVISPAVLAHGMTATTMIATFSALWACNHYFQSFGALSIVKINAAWFHLKERGKFAGIFGIMIQSGRLFAFAISPFILKFLPWQYAFWIPAAILAAMFFFNWKYVEDSPKKAGYDFETDDESKEEATQAPTLGFILRKVFASPSAWMIAFSSMCIGMVRNSIDQWWTRYIGTVFNLTAAQRATFAPYQFVSWATPVAAILGGIVAGNLSDRVFGSRRAPVIFFAFIGQALTLLVLSQTLHSAWLGCFLLVVMAFFIQSAHSLVGGAASMDFGGKKAVATAAGLFDGAQYLAGALVGRWMGQLLDAYKVAKAPGVEFDVWPLAPLPFAVIGAILIARLWNVVPGRPNVAVEGRARMLAGVHKAERIGLGGWAIVAGSISVLTIILPSPVAREIYGHPLQAGALLWTQVCGGARLALALVAMTAALSPRPPKALVRALVVGLIATIAGPLFSALTGGIPWAELAPLKVGMWLDGAVAALLLTTSVIRAVLAPLEK